MIKKIAARAYYGAALLALVWLVLSFLEVIAKNHAPAPIYNPLNAFIILLKIF